MRTAVDVGAILRDEAGIRWRVVAVTDREVAIRRLDTDRYTHEQRTVPHWVVNARYTPWTDDATP